MPSTENIVSISNDEYYVSYLEKTTDECRALDLMVAALRGLPEPPERPETALCVRHAKNGPITDIAFYILYGDHREAYANCKTLADCIEYFMANIHLMSHASNRPPEAKLNA